MAWDTEATRTKLLDAGMRQFAANGFTGARMDAIGRDAGVNKERVYRYFGDKAGLFTAVLTRELAGLLSGIDIGGIDIGGTRITGADSDREHLGPTEIGAFAGRLHDRCIERPELPRLLAWESLQLDDAAAVPARTTMCARNISGIRAALGDLPDDEAAAQLLFSVIAIVVSWWTLGALREAIPPSLHDPVRRRAVVVAQCTAMAQSFTGTEGYPGA